MAMSRLSVFAAAAVCLAGSLGLQAGPDVPAQADVDRRVEALLSRMTIEEKFGQLQQLSGQDGRGTPAQLDLARHGLLGSALNVRGAAAVNAFQRAAVEESRLKIPLLFGFDVIHGYRTVFPIPLAQAASWDPESVERASAIAAAESRAAGITWTFAPMIDIARDPRWGRIAEGSGEDPFLGAVMARARVRGFQGDDFSQPDRIVACAKHFVAYGAAEGGRDYNTTDMSERTLRSVYLPPFKAAVDAGVGTLMSAFNDLNGRPASGNAFTLTRVLRDEWKFDGFVVSDWSSIVEMIKHGVAADESDAAVQAITAGVDMEMASRAYANGPRLVKEGRLPISVVDEAVRRVLRVKMRAGLFERPYVDEAREKGALMRPEFRAAARAQATRSMVLLKNEGAVLPLSPSVGRLAVIGPLADSRRDMLGNWIGDGREQDVVTVLEGVKAAVSPQTTVVHAKGTSLDVKAFAGSASDQPLIDEAVAVARSADAVVLVIGEMGEMSGEAASRVSLDLPGRQQELAQAVVALGKPVAIVLMNGRPVTIGWLDEHAPAILEAWFPGTEAGHAVADVLFGKVNPGGKLPVTFPRTVGQVPIYYNHLRTGRPPDEKEKYSSKYLDAPWTPLYPFGHGLSYTTFRLSDLQLSAPTVRPDGSATVSVTVTNTGTRAGDEVVQLYVADVVRSISPPVQELRGFRRIGLGAGQSETVRFTLTREHLGFYDAEMKWTVEPGEFRIRVSKSSEGGLTARLDVVR